MPGIQPTSRPPVRRCVMPASGSRSAAASTASTFISGSPMPMNTRWLTASMPAEVQDLVEDLRRAQVAPEAHRARGAERAGQRAARLRRHAHRAPPVAVAHQHGLDRPAVGGARTAPSPCRRRPGPRAPASASRRARARPARRAASAGGRSSRRSRRRRGPPTPTPAGRGTPARRARPASRSRSSRSTGISSQRMRLAKFLAHAGVASRRAAEELIAAGGSRWAARS